MMKVGGRGWGAEVCVGDVAKFQLRLYPSVRYTSTVK